MPCQPHLWQQVPKLGKHWRVQALYLGDTAFLTFKYSFSISEAGMSYEPHHFSMQTCSL